MPSFVQYFVARELATQPMASNQTEPRTHIVLFDHFSRAAMKMANIDHVYDNMFTNPKDTQGVSERSTSHFRSQLTVDFINQTDR